MTPPFDHPVRLWLRPEQATLLAGVCRALEATVVSVGSALGGRAEEALATLTRLGVAIAPDGAATRSDLRADLASARGGTFILADPGPLGTGAEGTQRAVDLDTLRDATARGVRIISLEPIPASLLALAEAMAQPLPPLVLGPTDAPASTPPIGDSGDAGAAGAGGAWAALAPAARLSQPVQDVLHLREQFGAVRSAVVQCLGAPADGSLGARLFDAMDIVQLFLGEPESIDASYTGPTPDASRPVYPLPGDTLRNLHGDLTANLRFSAGRAAALAASDQAGRFETLVTLIGPAGRIRIYNDGFEWTDPHGEKLDESRAVAAKRPRATTRKPRGAAAAEVPAVATLPPPPPLSPCGSALVQQIRRLVELGPAATAGQNYARVLSMAQAALLSARTGEGESPATMLRLLRG